MRLSFILRLLEEIHGISSEAAFVRGTDGKPVAYPASSSDKKFQTIFQQVRALTGGYSGAAEPVIGSICDKCKWKDACREEAEESGNVTLLFYAGEKVRDGFSQLGISNISELAQADPEDLWHKVSSGIGRGLFYKSFGKELVTSLVKRAELYMKATETPDELVYTIANNAPKFPKSTKEIHYDIEDDPINGFVYLHGFIVIEEGKETEYVELFAETPLDEAAIAENLWAFFEENEGVPVYHYSGHEAKTCKKLMDKYGLSETTYNAVFGVGGTAIDLYEWVVKYTNWPLTSYGLKPLCKYTGFVWSAEDAGGAQSIDWLYQYQAGKTEMKEKILTYNKEDCLATAHLKNWLLTH